MRRVDSMPIVPISAHTHPSANASATPPSKITDSTASSVGSIVITTSASRTASGAVGATTAPAAASGEVAAADRSHTRVFRPAATRLRLIADPMIPAPSTATVVRASLPFAPTTAVPSLDCLESWAQPRRDWFGRSVRHRCAPQRAPFVLRGAAPDTGNLSEVQGSAQARCHHRAALAYALGRLDVAQGRA